MHILIYKETLLGPPNQVHRFIGRKISEMLLHSYIKNLIVLAEFCADPCAGNDGSEDYDECGSDLLYRVYSSLTVIDSITVSTFTVET